MCIRDRDGTTNVMGESLGYVLPVEFDRLFSLEDVSSSKGGIGGAGRKAESMLIRSRRGSVQDADPMNTGILNAIVKLGNTVLMNKALAELNAYRAKKAPGFQKPEMFRKAMALLASHAYRIPQYRFVIDLFDKSVLRKMVLEDEEESESDEHEGADSAAEVGV